jgi:hypothetical protein
VNSSVVSKYNTFTDAKTSSSLLLARRISANLLPIAFQHK